VDLPANYGSNTVWQIGEVPAGGVADTWFDDDVHGSFRVRNSGDTKADIWIVAEDDRGVNPFAGTGLRPTGALPTFEYYALACATNVEDLLPDWQLLDQVFSPDEVGAVLGRTLAGDYILFDLKFYAPENPPSGTMNDYRFRIGIEAICPFEKDKKSSPYRLYSVMAATNAGAQAWSIIPGYEQVPGTGGDMACTNGAAGRMRFFRGHVEQDR